MNDFEITSREIIASISILAIMLIFGLIIGGNIEDNIKDEQAKYLKAFKIDNDKDLFIYAMSTDKGNCFVEGEIKTVDPVSHEDVKGEYLILERVKEEYTMHTRTVTYTDSKGKTRTRTETYWTWDYAGKDTYKAQEVTFLDTKFKTSKFDLPGTSYLDTVSGGYHVRYKFYGLDTSFKATIFAQLKDDTIIGDKVPVYRDQKIQEVLEDLTNDTFMYFYWFVWILLTAVVIYGFYYLDNDWLNRD